MQLANNVVLITGRATGVGYAMAEAFLAAGSRFERAHAHMRRERFREPAIADWRKAPWKTPI